MEIRAFGIIPAYAGQIVYIYLETVHFQDHPRIRGTNFSIYHFKGLHTGSSPHTRDKCDVPTGVIIKFGIIPAYAGQMVDTSNVKMNDEDHPRIRGTNHRLRRLRP